MRLPIRFCFLTVFAIDSYVKFKRRNEIFLFLTRNHLVKTITILFFYILYSTKIYFFTDINPYIMDFSHTIAEIADNN